MARLTEASIPKLLPAKGQAELRDDTIRGLMLRGNKNGASWSLRFTHQGDKQRHTIGRWPGVSLTAARRAAQAVYGDIALGRPPERATKVLTLADALDRAEKLGFTHLSRPSHYFGTMRRHLSHLLNRDLRTITKGEILSAADKVRLTLPATADVLLRVSKPVWRWWSERDYCDDILASVRVAQTSIRDEYLTVEQARSMYEALQGFNYPYKQAFSVLLLTAGRRNEVLEMRKAELDLDAGLWTIPAERMKNRLPWRIPLAPAAVEHLREALELSPAGPWVFSTTGKAPSKGIDKALNRLRREIDVPNFRLHDLRRTFATAMADEEYEPGTVDRALNHVGSGSNSRLSRIYNKSDLLPIRTRMANEWADMICGDK